MMEQTFSINKYLPVALLYFFFNTFLLPLGLLYTTILTPFFLWWLYRFPTFKYVWLFFVIMLPFVVVHLHNGVNLVFYAKSFILLFSVYVFSLTFYQFLKICKSLRVLYKNILHFNILFLFLALIALLIPVLKEKFWYSTEITTGLHISRLRMLTYEPSYYSTLFVPIALYYYLKLIVLKLPNPYWMLVWLTVPLLLSLSFGVILGLAFALGITLLYGLYIFFPNKNVPIYVFMSVIVIIIGLIFFILLFPHNVFVLRLSNVFTGRDSSFKGRTFDSLYLGWKIASEKSIYFGCGLGQVKEIGLDILKKYYDNPFYTIQNTALSNSVGDTLAIFGIIGLAIRMLLEVYLFFKTRVYNNYYRFSLFTYIFIYQFTGSFITNIAEYVIWVLAFTDGIFEEFDKKAFSPYSSSPTPGVLHAEPA